MKIAVVSKIRVRLKTHTIIIYYRFGLPKQTGTHVASSSAHFEQEWTGCHVNFFLFQYEWNNKYEKQEPHTCNRWVYWVIFGFSLYIVLYTKKTSSEPR